MKWKKDGIDVTDAFKSDDLDKLEEISNLNI